jgi:hypothetical protein
MFYAFATYLAESPLTDAPQASIAGLITACATVLIAVGGVITALSVLVPILRQTKQNTKNIAENQAVTTSKLNVIHTLVNSTLTAALQSELDATRREEMLLRELMSMRGNSTDDDHAALGAVQRKISELSSAMKDRAEQTRKADIQIAQEHERAKAN